MVKKYLWASLLGSISLLSLWGSSPDDDDCDCNCDNHDDHDCHCDHDHDDHDCHHDHRANDDWRDTLADIMFYEEMAWRAEQRSKKTSSSNPNRALVDATALRMAEEQRQAKLQAQRLAEAERHREKLRQEKAEREFERQLKKQRRKAYWKNGKLIPVGFDCNDLLGLPLEDTRQKLYAHAFEIFDFSPVKDIDRTSTIVPGTVCGVSIAGVQDFTEHDEFPYDSLIVIYYHTKKEISIPYSSKQYRKRDYEEVFDELDSLGFTNIQLVPTGRTIDRLFHKKYSVRSIYINNNSFPSDALYKFDAKIVIEYQR